MWTKSGVSQAPLKILLVGNSFSVDATEWLYSMCLSAGISNITIGVAYDSGQSLPGHWGKIQSNSTITAYNKWSPATGYVSTPNALVKNILTDEAWDFISLQQRSSDSGKYETFQPALKSLVTYIKGVATNKKLRLALHMTWAYATGNTGLSGYGDSQTTMYTAITDAYLKAMNAEDIGILIPSGTSLQNARSSSYLKAVGNDITRDGQHLDYGMGRYIACLTIFEALVAEHYKKDIFADVTFKPNVDADDSYFNAYLAKVAVKRALANPFSVSTI